VVNGTAFVNNDAPAGGALYLAWISTAEFDGATFDGNSAGGGGAISSYTTDLTITSSTFVGNTAGGGGAILSHNGFSGGLVVLSGSTLDSNSATSEGGA